MSGDEQSPGSWAGQLVVATPTLTDASFARTVVLLLQHGRDDGAFGLVLNRPSDTDVDDVLPGWQERSAVPRRLFTGGPVQPSAAVCLGRLPAGTPPSDSYAPLPARLGADLLATVDLDADPVPGLREVRVFAGYAGWSAGQLEGEVEQDAWWVLDALPGDAFTAAPELLWQQVLRRQGPPLAFVAGYPDDPTLN